MKRDNWTVCLSGEIHADWREMIANGIDEAGLPVSLLGPVTDHADSDDCGDAIFGAEADTFWKDHKSAKVNVIRARSMIERSDMVVGRFDEQYKQWNAAFDAGFAAALGKPLIILHDPKITHPLKEVDGAALAVAQTPEQVVKLLAYIIDGTL